MAMKKDTLNEKIQTTEESIEELAGVLERERDTLEVIMESTQAQLAYLDPHFNFVRVNAAYAQGSGHSKEELLGRNHFELFPNPENQAIFEQVRDTGQPVEFRAKPFEYANQPGRGITYWDWTLVPVKGRNGQVQGLVLSLMDVTERERARIALRRYADRLRVMHEIDKAILAAQTADEIANVTLLHLHKLVPYRLASVELFDLEAGEASVLSVRAEEETTIETDRRHRLVWYEPIEALREGRPYIVEDIQTVPANPFVEALQDEGVRSFASVPLIAQGELIGCLGFARDELGGLTGDELEVIRDLGDQLAIGIQQARLHEQVQCHTDELEQLVAERTTELQASEARFRAVFEHAAIGISLADMDGRLTATNPALQEMLGYSGEELRGMVYTEITHPDDVAASVDLYQELVAGERDYYTVDKRCIRKDGRGIWGRLTASLVQGVSGQPQYAICMVEDITEQKQAQETIIQSEKLTIAGRLGASLAHEINNPLQSVLGCLGLAEEILDDGAEVRGYLKIAMEELERAAGIVTQLRDLSRESEVKKKEPADLNALVEKALLLTRKRCQNRGVEVEWRPASGLPTVPLMPDRMQQVFLNLVLNAVEAMPDGGRLEVGIAHTSQPEGARITFADTGMGIEPDRLPRMFEPFYTTRSEGLGLGLYISKKIIEEHGGSIVVDSRVREGTTFTVWLPR
jgi:PAS domain S-box-containing protein